MILYSFFKAILGPLFRLLFGIRYYGKENIPQNENYIISANHTCWYDPVFIALASKQKLHFMAKRELFKNPIVAALLKSVGAFPVNRRKTVDAGDRPKDSFSGINSAMEVLNSGGCIGLFPEGTRVKAKMGEVKAKAGVSMLAAKCGVKIIPVGIKTPTRPFKRTDVHIGTPISFPKDKYGKLTHDEYEKMSQQVLEEIKRLRDL